MNNYKFYHKRGLNARVGLAYDFESLRLAIHFPSKGSSQRAGQPNKRRNPDRRALHTAMIEALDLEFEDTPNIWGEMLVGIMAYGPGGNMKQKIAYLHPSDIVNAWPENLPAVGNDAYTLYVAPSNILATKLYRTENHDRHDAVKESLRAVRIFAAATGLVRFMPNNKHPRPVAVRWDVLKK